MPAEENNNSNFRAIVPFVAHRAVTSGIITDEAGANIEALSGYDCEWLWKCLSDIIDGIRWAIRSEIRFVDLKFQDFVARWRCRISMKTRATYSHGKVCFEQHCRRPYPNPSWYNKVIKI